MKRVITIDGITLDNSCFISSEFDVDDFIGVRSIAIDGSSVLFVQSKGSMTKQVQITSKNSGWVSKDTKDLLFASVDVSAITVEFDDASTSTYYYDHERVPMKLTPLYEGSLWYNVEINLLKG